MVFEHHKLKLKEVQKNLKNGNYAEANVIIDKHFQNELKGTAILNSLRTYVNEYEQILKELNSDIDALTQDKREKRVVPNRELRVEQCLGKVALAKQRLDSIKELMESALELLKE